MAFSKQNSLLAALVSLAPLASVTVMALIPFVLAPLPWLGSTAFAVHVKKVKEPLTITLEVNGVRKQIASNHILTLVAGDITKIISAVYGDGTVPAKVNFVGFPNKNPKAPADDRGYTINTGKDLLVSWSKDKQGKEYRIDISRTDEVVATIPVRMIKPELLYVIAEINGKERVLRPGEVSAIKETDDFEIVRVVSNMADLDPSVRFNMESQTVEDRKVYSMNFFRHDRPFGHIQLEIQ